MIFITGDLGSIGCTPHAGSLTAVMSIIASKKWSGRSRAIGRGRSMSSKTSQKYFQCSSF